MHLHTETRSKKIITQLHDLGLNVSYNRVLQLESWLATAVCESFQKKGVVVPTQLRRGLFTAGALDNLDHNPSSTTARGSFHGTRISLFQFPLHLAWERSRMISNWLWLIPRRIISCLVMVPAVALKMATVLVSLQSGASSPKEGQLSGAFLKEKSWLDHAIQVLLKNEIEKGDTVAWSAFHTSMLDVSTDLPTTLTQLLPLFYKEAAGQL